jgi:nicotinate-nucleotide adenylyltransferase
MPLERAGTVVRLPPHRPGMRIGLYGGSFDPAHPGHRHVAVLALKRLQLDRVWWMVTPGNPLKDRSRLASAEARSAATQKLARHPRMAVTEFEAEIGAAFTVETLRFLRRRCPGTCFVFIMGADSWAGLHRWRGWREIARLVPIAVIDRPGWTLRATGSRAGLALGSYRVPERAASTLALRFPPAWAFLHGPRSHLSSTALRSKLANVIDQH